MTEDNAETPAKPPSGPRSGLSLAIWLPAVTFLAGALIGGVVIGVASGSDPDGGGDASTNSASGADATSSSQSANPEDTTMVIPAACSEASDSVQEAVRLLGEAAGYVRDFRPKELRQVLNELETTDQQLRGQAKDCSDIGVTSP